MHGMTGKGARRNHILMANFRRHSHCVALQELGTLAGREDSQLSWLLVGWSELIPAVLWHF